VKIFDLKANQKAHLDRAKEASANGDVRGYNESMLFVNSIEKEIRAIEGSPDNSIRRMQGPSGEILADKGPRPTGRRALGAGYTKAIHHLIASRGVEMMPERRGWFRRLCASNVIRCTVRRLQRGGRLRCPGNRG
jgi:hypothetical protein